MPAIDLADGHALSGKAVILAGPDGAIYLYELNEKQNADRCFRRALTLEQNPEEREKLEAALLEIEISLRIPSWRAASHTSACCRRPSG